MGEANGKANGLEYAWQYLVEQEYGRALWGMAKMNGEEVVAILAHETTDDVLGLPEDCKAPWRAGSFRLKLAGQHQKVVPVVLMAKFEPLETFYEVWFNVYADKEWPEREAFTALSKQTFLPLLFFDRGPSPVREFYYVNTLRRFFSSQYHLLRLLPPWTDNDFKRAKEQIEEQYSSERMWEVLGQPA